MEEIKQLRKRIDEIDEQILQALSERVKTCKSIGLVKKKSGISIKDLPRENEVYTRIREKAGKFGLDPVQVEAVYCQIINMCSFVQELEEKSDG